MPILSIFIHAHTGPAFRIAVGDDGHSALHWAALKGNLRAMLLLLRSGARVDAQDNWRFTPLIRAAQNGHLLAVLLLLQVRWKTLQGLNRLGIDIVRH